MFGFALAPAGLRVAALRSPHAFLLSLITCSALISCAPETESADEVKVSSGDMCAQNAGLEFTTNVSIGGNEQTVGYPMPKEGTYYILNGKVHEETVAVTVTDQSGNCQWIQGKGSHFGGPNDTGVSAQEPASFTGEILRRVDTKNRLFAAIRATFLHRDVQVGSARPQPKSTAWWNHIAAAKDAWANRRILVCNPANSQCVVVQLIDWGPNANTDRIIDLSQGAMNALGAKTDDPLLMALAK